MRQALAALAAAATMIFGAAATADTYPSRPTSIIVTFPAGGPADSIARLIAARLSVRLGQAVMVDNRAGAGGNIGAEFLARAPADGYTLMLGSSPVLVINTSLYSGLKYDPLLNFEPLIHAGSLPNVVVVRSDVPAKNLQELIKLGKRPNSNLSFASAGNGGTSHLAGVLFSQMTGVPLTHAAFRGTAPAVQALLGGHVTMTFTDVLTALPHIQSGKFRPLGVTASSRSHVLPDVPTLAEQGLTGFDVSVFFALVAPRGLPPEVKRKLGTAMQQIFAEPEFQAELQKKGLQLPAQTTPEYLEAVMKREIPQWRKLIQETGAKPE